MSHGFTVHELVQFRLRSWRRYGIPCAIFTEWTDRWPTAFRAGLLYRILHKSGNKCGKQGTKSCIP